MDHRLDPAIQLFLFSLCSFSKILAQCLSLLLPVQFVEYFSLLGVCFSSPPFYIRKTIRRMATVESQTASLTESDTWLTCLMRNIFLKYFRKILEYGFNEQYESQKKYLTVYHFISIQYWFSGLILIFPIIFLISSCLCLSTTYDFLFLHFFFSLYIT